MYLAGIPIYDIMRVTGHKSINTLEKYIRADKLGVARNSGTVTVLQVRKSHQSGYIKIKAHSLAVISIFLDRYVLCFFYEKP